MQQDQVLDMLFKPKVDDSTAAVLVYSPRSSPRLEYVCEFIFRQLRLNHRIIHNETELPAFKGLVINYSEKDIEGVLSIIPSGVLFESNVRLHVPASSMFNELWLLYPNDSSLGFDVFSAVFYMISRYEEWQEFNADTHNRFEAKESILNKNGILLKPIVDLWILELKLHLLKHYPDTIFPVSDFKTIASIDVDNLFAYKAKGMLRTIGACTKDLLKLDLINLKRRINVIRGINKDPFDIYSPFSEFCFKNNIPLIWFFLMASGNRYDRAVQPTSERYNSVIRKLIQNKSLIGLHPSYFCEEKKLLSTEKKLLEKNVNTTVVASRQHYLRFNIRSTPAFLLQQGIKYDFTTGFASSPGFRAGTSYPFYYYDFKNEAGGNLLMIPFCAMDGAFTVYDNLNASQTFNQLKNLRDEIKKVGGYFITVFHERTFDDEIARGYGEMYKDLLAD
jgi:hypothetical protein